MVIITNNSGPPAEAFLHPLTEDRMLTNVDARTNARLNYNHQIMKYVYHGKNDADRLENPVPINEYSHMAQSHKKTTAARWLKDYLGKPVVRLYFMNT